MKPDRYDPITADIVPVFFHYAIPSVLGMLAATTAGVIDGIFVGNYVGADALAAINICMPVFALFTASVFMLAVGGSVMCGKFIGEGRSDAASSIFSKTLYASLCVASVISALILLFMTDVVALLGANEELRESARDYMTIIVYAAPLLILGLTLEFFVRVDGRPIFASGALMCFAVLNIALDWLLIAQWGWGIKGAAWATAIAEGCVFFIMVTHLFSARCTLKLVSIRSRVGGGWKTILDAAYNGFSEFANEMSIGLTTLLFNWVMITRLGVEGVAAFTIIGYLLWFGLEVSYGISESLQPIVSKNLGARLPSRIVGFGVTAVISSFVVGLAVSSLFLLIPETLIALFLRDGEGKTVAIALAFIAVFWPAFLFNGVNITLSSYFTAMHKPMQSAAIAIARSLLLPVAGVLLLPIWFGDKGVYAAIPAAEVLTFGIATIMVLRNKPSKIIQAMDRASRPGHSELADRLV
jgi:putative MATE family efflux protein